MFFGVGQFDQYVDLIVAEFETLFENLMQFYFFFRTDLFVDV